MVLIFDNMSEKTVKWLKTTYKIQNIFFVSPLDVYQKGRNYKGENIISCYSDHICEKSREQHFFLLEITSNKNIIHIKYLLEVL